MHNRVKGLDGLRGIAVLAVVIYHAEVGAFSGGFLGVDIFFVLSGFLITALLLRELEHTGRINRAWFYIKRIRRLVPALVLVIVVTILITGIWIPDAAFGVRRDLPWALTFVLNWSYLFFKESYFVTFARPPMFQHLWSLAIEEQFYVVWPLVLLGLARIRPKWLSLRALVFTVAVVGAVLSTIWMRALSIRYGMPIPHDPSRLYFGTDTHAMSLLIGCATATLWRPERQRQQLTPDRLTALNALGVGGCAVISWYLLRGNEFDANLYHSGFLVVAIATGVVTLVSTHPALRFGMILGNPILRWFGERSYGIYLWHWPVFMALRPGLDVSWPDAVTEITRVILVLGFAELSYRFVEMPIRRGYLARTFRKWRLLGVPRLGIPSVTLTTAIAMMFSLSLFGIARATAPDAAHTSGFSGLTAIDIDPTPIETPKPKPSTSIPVKPTHTPAPKPSHVPKPVVGDVFPTVFGDSVVLGSHSALQRVLGRISIDASVGRQPSEIASRITLRKQEHRLGRSVVIHMGTNGYVREQDLEPILMKLRDRQRVVVVNVRVPRVWGMPSNNNIALITQKFKNVRVANWYARSAGHPDYFVSDGVHLTPQGARVFAYLIKQTLSAP